ncbi:helix-turn-helix domain-containing protein [Acidipropionibacterium timonense]|uniref:helix-turn-helix domain-containing protein n=1 Tax=Acidipropionibacterium timonense TaxID=2161818 RepID=UPI001030DDEA|nr:helix-turn-helix domain-containing protein [Acidipropionibacterium timonense]
MAARAPRLVGQERRDVADDLAVRYQDGASIRSLAQETGRSYGLVQKLLREAGVEFRSRGGADPASPRTRALREEVAEAAVRAADEAESRERRALAASDPAAMSSLQEAVEVARQEAARSTRKATKAKRKVRKLRDQGASKAKRKAARRKADKRADKAVAAQRMLEQAQAALEEARRG